MSAGEFRFKMWATTRHYDPYYYTNWDGKRKITVVATDQQTALTSAKVALGDPGRDHHWVFKTVSITDHRIPDTTDPGNTT